MNNYTVLLLRPDYIADEFGKDTYLAHVVANGPALAAEKAQMEAWVTDNGGPDEIENDADGEPSDYCVLFATLGHHENLTST